MHAQRVTAQPLDVLRAIPSLELVPLTESDVCCGSAGIYNLVEPETSDVVLQRKIAHVAAARADVIATGNPGCLMQIGAGLVRNRSTVETRHPVELLDQSYSADGTPKR
jgi:glycolate oxidase iron-sulfur subunit